MLGFASFDECQTTGSMLLNPIYDECDRLEARHPDAQIWIVRIGSRHVRRFGGRTRRPP